MTAAYSRLCPKGHTTTDPRICGTCEAQSRIEPRAPHKNTGRYVKTVCKMGHLLATPDMKCPACRLSLKNRKAYVSRVKRGRPAGSADIKRCDKLHDLRSPRPDCPYCQAIKLGRRGPAVGGRGRYKPSPAMRGPDHSALSQAEMDMADTRAVALLQSRRRTEFNEKAIAEAAARLRAERQAPKPSSGYSGSLGGGR